MIDRKPNRYWTYDRCKEAALLSKTKTELLEKYRGAYNLIHENKWFELITHFIELKKPHGYWTYERCKEVALSCKTKTELNASAYRTICRNKWFELIKHFIKKIYWTYERCKIEALKYNSRTEMSKVTNSYRVILKNKWFELFEHMKTNTNTKKRLIYVYEFSDNRCYIGLTGDVKRRNNQHLIEDENSSVYKYMIESGLKPELCIKTEYVPVEESILLEEKILNNYKDRGWIILNKIKTGGIGSPNIKWTKDACEKEAKKYDRIIIFQNNSTGAYSSAL